ncbi:MAG: 30S ribosome-binding factor RbfA [Chloroflexi bacterium]|nr:30S ribosome-binding factor RbfA [Chloroflexota bacterium]
MTIKSERVADLILSHLSQLMLTEVRDPRLHGVTIMEVRLDREIEHAEIFVNALGDESRRDEVMEGLRQAQGFLRKELASRLRLRRMPQLHFKWDVVLQQANHIEEVLDALAEREQSASTLDDMNDDDQE